MTEHNAPGTSTDVRVAIVGVGNCASSLVQGVQYYRDADPNSTVPGLMHVTFGQYHVRDVKFVAAFDVDAKKVGFDLSEAIFASENNTIKKTGMRITPTEQKIVATSRLPRSQPSNPSRLTISVGTPRPIILSQDTKRSQ